MIATTVTAAIPPIVGSSMVGLRTVLAPALPPSLSMAILGCNPWSGSLPLMRPDPFYPNKGSLTVGDKRPCHLPPLMRAM